MAKLIYQQPDGKNKDFKVGAKPVTVGRGMQVDFQLPDEKVSRMHFGIRHQDGNYIIRDLHSTNGTVVNGEKLSGPKTLQDGDKISVGGTEMQFKLDPTDKAKPE